MLTDGRTRQAYPPDGTVVAALFLGSVHWHTGPIRWAGGNPHIMCEDDRPLLLERAAHWYEVGVAGRGKLVE